MHVAGQKLQIPAKGRSILCEGPVINSLITDPAEDILNYAQVAASTSSNLRRGV
jgi:hypothetical protein